MKKRLLTIVPFLLGLFLCGYPLISSLVERQHQQNAVATYKGMINKESLETLKESTERAKRYNNLLWQVNDAIVGDAVLVSGIQKSDNISTALFGIMAYTVVLCFSLFKTGSLAKSIFGAH